MIIVCDSSPLIALATCGALNFLEKLFESVYVTPMVYQEICQKDKPHSQQLSDYFADKIYQDFHLDNDSPLLNVLDIGEVSAFQLYQCLHADILLIDEKKGRKIAHDLSIEIIGSLGILLMAKQAGLINEIKPFLDKLVQSPLFFSQNILHHTLALANELN